MKKWLVSDPRGKIFYSINNWAIPILILSLGSGYLQIDFPGQLVGRHGCGLGVGWLACFARAAGLWLFGCSGCWLWLLGLLGFGCLGCWALALTGLPGFLLLRLWLLGSGCSGCWALAAQGAGLCSGCWLWVLGSSRRSPLEKTADFLLTLEFEVVNVYIFSIIYSNTAL
jgi:hypothetical protein